MAPSTLPSPADFAGTLDDLRRRRPLVQCLTNIVVAPWTANVLLAAGASPAMVDNPHESGAFATIADAVLINLGTPYDDTAEAMRSAVAAAADSGTPWVLDPVAAGAAAWRTTLALDLLEGATPRILRGNASEILAIAGGAGGRGADAADTVESAADTARDLAQARQTVVAVSGAVDHLTDGERLLRLGNGDPLMTQVTGMGCALGALMAATSAVTDDGLLAAATATALLTVAADRALPHSRGPGSFAVAVLDELALVTPDDLADLTRVL